MEIQDNPFTSRTFSQIWLKHFNNSVEAIQFPFIGDIRFIKHSFFNTYTNVGSTHTKGIDYMLQGTDFSSLGNKVLLVHDVPEFFGVNPSPANSGGIIKVRQYPGYLINLNGVDSLESYLRTAFSKSSRYKLKKYRKRLEQSFDVRYEMYTGDIGTKTFESIFEAFRKLLIKRFDQKRVYNNNLDDAEWNFYREVVLPMLQEEKAGLFVVYASNIPVAITLTYFSDSIVFDAITVFNIDFGKFHPGSVSIMGLLEWCLDNQMVILDFSKGYFDYKARWATDRYNFEYHILYNRKSMVSALTARTLGALFKVKQALRDRRLNEKFNALTFRFKAAPDPKLASNSSYRITDMPGGVPAGPKIEQESEEFRSSLTAICECLYLTGDHIGEVALYRVRESPGHYYLLGPKTNKEIMREDYLS